MKMPVSSMRGRTLSLQPVATGLLIANLIVIGAAIASLLVARRAWDLREHALTELAEARAAVSSSNPVRAKIRAPLAKLRAATMDRILLWGFVGAAGSAFFTWRLIVRSRALVRASGVAARSRVVR